MCVLSADGLKVTHPHAIQLAVATRQSIERGLVVQSSEEFSEKELHAHLVKVANLAPFQYRDGQVFEIEVLLVDVGALFKLKLYKGQTEIIRYATSVRSTLPRIVTTQDVIQALGKLHLSFGKAVDLNLIEIEVANVRDIEKAQLSAK